ncbi:cobyrinic acid a,c-diamide synthase [Desulfocicer vacuolatum DSM 3385]|uniref:Cobyrinate a,c-diamide synthase n=1 Tax=Desulfocicer vacuolatum DSM 3385 TaxID=1121400 RepID=A0A1W2A5B2_9BACT|nr:cobyrinate a,c-diamide synthase [Desulfocicer vacuolatum]SMC55864.1 cobyrinic acid a,c-diamide synthase [Desulfocicer vacuolatum DSM 3385]
MQYSNKKIPGLVIAGLRGGNGKTVISLGVTAAWRDIGINVAPFKKGPDYIDAGWLSKAAGRSCYNLDTFMCSTDQAENSFLKNSAMADIALIEGNRGLYDGIDIQGRTSTAEIAKLLNLPVVLVLDCTKSTRTMAALLLGCIHFDPHVNIMGVILNRVAGKRHENKVKDNIKQFCNIPVFGSVPKLKAEDFPERHMGLVPSAEHELALESIKAAARVARKYIDLDGLYRACINASKIPAASLSSSTPPHNTLCEKCGQKTSMDCDTVADGSCGKGGGKTQLQTAPIPHIPKQERPIIGVIRDSAFQFYYPDNLESLEESGAILQEISPLKASDIPPVDAIYMGGGFPETHAAQLADNESFRNQLKALAMKGLPIYAECGGLIFLGKSLTLDGVTYAMSDILPVSFGLSKRPVGHGYTQVRVIQKNPFFPRGTLLRGHEFRYSHIMDIDYRENEMVFAMERGKGIIDKKDGFCRYNVFGTYTHTLSSCASSWSHAMVKQALQYKTQK